MDGWVGACADSIVKLDALRKEDPASIIAIWMQYHVSKDACAAAVLSRPEYDTLSFRGQKSPLCIAPIRKGSGHLTMVSQFKKDKLIVTTLEEYQIKQELATPVLIASLYNELLPDKELALLRSDFAPESITKEETVRLIADLLFCYYDTDTYKDVVKLNAGAPDFDFELFINRLFIREPPPLP